MMCHTCCSSPSCASHTLVTHVTTPSRQHRSNCSYAPISPPFSHYLLPLPTFRWNSLKSLHCPLSRWNSFLKSLHCPLFAGGIPFWNPCIALFEILALSSFPGGIPFWNTPVILFLKSLHCPLSLILSLFETLILKVFHIFLWIMDRYREPMTLGSLIDIPPQIILSPRVKGDLQIYISYLWIIVCSFSLHFIILFPLCNGWRNVVSLCGCCSLGHIPLFVSRFNRNVIFGYHFFITHGDSFFHFHCGVYYYFYYYALRIESCDAKII